MGRGPHMMKREALSFHHDPPKMPSSQVVQSRRPTLTGHRATSSVSRDDNVAAGSCLQSHETRHPLWSSKEYAALRKAVSVELRISSKLTGFALWLNVIQISDERAAVDASCE